MAVSNTSGLFAAQAQKNSVDRERYPPKIFLFAVSAAQFIDDDASASPTEKQRRFAIRNTATSAATVYIRVQEAGALQAITTTFNPAGGTPATNGFPLAAGEGLTEDFSSKVRLIAVSEDGVTVANVAVWIYDIDLTENSAQGA